MELIAGDVEAVHLGVAGTIAWDERAIRRHEN
jgi:hypothetical protein